MRPTVSLLVSAVLAVGLFASIGAAPADAELGCPQRMTPAPRAFVHQGERKDHNNNGVVCVTPTTCVASSGQVCHGGPDDDIYGDAPRLGADDLWYYVLDDA